MIDRAEQARAEAERRSPHDPEGYTTSEARGEFRAGGQWADANPAPRTITREEFESAYTYFFDGFPSREKTLEFLWTLGTEVEDER